MCTIFPRRLQTLIIDHFQDPEDAVIAIYEGFWNTQRVDRRIKTIQSRAGLFNGMLMERPCTCHPRGSIDANKAVGVRYSTLVSMVLDYARKHDMLKPESKAARKLPSTKVRVHQIAIIVKHTINLSKPLMPLLEDWIAHPERFLVLHRCGNGMITGLTCTEPSHLVFGSNETNSDHKHFHWIARQLLEKGSIEAYTRLRCIHNTIQKDDLF